MNIRVIELCSYGEIGDYEALDLDAEPLNLDFVPPGWAERGGNHEARKYVKDSLELQVYVEGRLILFSAPTRGPGREMAQELLELWPRNTL